MSRRASGERGWAMAALLVAMNIMAIMLAAALPAWRTYAQREKEAELVFRGEQYARAITLFQRARGNQSPPNIDVLVNERFLRKKYKDPITGDDFQLIGAGAALPGDTAPQPSGQGRGGLNAPPSEFDKARQALDERLRRSQQQTSMPGTTGTGIVGVTSKSSEKSFRLYKGRDTYNQWVFMGVQQTNRAGGPGGRAGAVGPGDGRGGRGQDGRGGLPPLPPLPGRGVGPQTPPRGAPPPPTQPGRGFGGRNFPN